MIINLDYTSEIPIYLQLRNEIVKGMNKDEFINTCKALLQTIQYDASIVQ